MTMTLPRSGETAAVSMDMRMEFSHFGVAPKVHLPSPAHTFDATRWRESNSGSSTATRWAR